MKRDMDLVRKILFALEASDQLLLAADDTAIDGYDSKIVRYHYTILRDSPYVTIETDRGLITHYRLTWQGYEFLESIRDDTRWEQVTEATQKAGGASFEIIANVAAQLLGAVVMRYTGLA